MATYFWSDWIEAAMRAPTTRSVPQRRNMGTFVRPMRTPRRPTNAAMWVQMRSMGEFVLWWNLKAM